VSTSPQGVARARRSFRDQDETDQEKRQEKENKERTRKDKKASATLFPDPAWANLVSTERQNQMDFGYQTDLGLLRVAIDEDEIQRVGTLFDTMWKAGSDSQRNEQADAFTATDADVTLLVDQLSDSRNLDAWASKLLPETLVTELQRSFPENEAATDELGVDPKSPKNDRVHVEELGRVISKSEFIEWWTGRQELECSVKKLQDTAETLGWPDEDLDRLRETLKPDYRRELVFIWPKEETQPEKEDKQLEATNTEPTVGLQSDASSKDEEDEAPTVRMQNAIKAFVAEEDRTSLPFTAFCNAFAEQIVRIYGDSRLAEEHVQVEEIQSDIGARATGGLQKSNMASDTGANQDRPMIIVTFSVDSSIVTRGDRTLETKINNSEVKLWCPFSEYDVPKLAAGHFWSDLAVNKTPMKIQMCVPFLSARASVTF
jgi:hypothetical protein